MNLHSVRTRLVGSYLFLLALFIIQLPIVYFLATSMGEKYALVDSAGALRKRAVEIVSILYQHIVSGDEELESVFQKKKQEYGVIIDGFRTGTPELPAIKDAETLKKLEAVAEVWGGMRSALDSAMDTGDRLHATVEDLQNTTEPMLKGVGGSSAFTGESKTRTLYMSYLVERLVRENDDSELSKALRQEVEDFERSLKAGALGIETERVWQKRKGLILETIESKAAFKSKIKELTDVHSVKLVAAADGLTKQISANAKKGALKAIAAMAASILVSAFLVGVFLWTTNHHILNPIFRIKQTVEEYARGNLTRRAEVRTKLLGREIKDEITSLGESVDEMADQMSDIIGQIKDSSTQLASASEELSASATQISSGADKQSSQTTQVATAMEEMKATVIEVAKNSQQASESAKSAQEIAAGGGEVVTQVITAMREVAESTSVTAENIRKLGKSSEEIGTIISVINDIADQTNLLALNAAIEAARAGEQGRGFAVVADEVRRLAERTTRATKEISTMINTIQGETGKAVNAMAEGALKVENGVKLANEGGEALRQILASVENVSNMISHIATAAEEQTATTEEITQNMDSISQVAKANVSTISEVAKATDELARLATQLQDIVLKFRISEAEAAATASNTSSPQKRLYLVKDGSSMREVANID